MVTSSNIQMTARPMADPTIRLRSAFDTSINLAIFVINGIDVRFATYDPKEHAMRWLQPQERR
jgi:hypothetical protein